MSCFCNLAAGALTKKLYENTAVLEKARPPNCALAKFGILYQSWDMLKGR